MHTYVIIYENLTGCICCWIPFLRICNREGPQKRSLQEEATFPPCRYFKYTNLDMGFEDPRNGKHMNLSPSRITSSQQTFLMRGAWEYHSSTIQRQFAESAQE